MIRKACRLGLGMAILFMLAAGIAWGQEGGYDKLPLTLDEMDEYDRIAMEPYKDTYDSMTLGEKARSYAVVFEFMRDRPPNFPEEVVDAMKRFERAQQPTSVYESKQHLYKAPPPKRRPGSDRQVLRGLPGPWEQAARRQAEEEEQIERYRSSGLMESLRYGSKDAIKQAGQE